MTSSTSDIPAIPRIVGVAIVLMSWQGILLQHRLSSADDGGGKLVLPGGKLQNNETTLDAAIRETWEEVGIELRPYQLQSLGFSDSTHPSGAQVTMLYMAASLDNSQAEAATNMEPTKCACLQWASPQALPENMWYRDVYAIRQASKLAW